MFVLGLLLLFAPTFVFGIDQLDIPLPGDEFVWAVTLGVSGLLLLSASQRKRLGQAIAAAIAGAVGLAVQFYLIAVFVLHTTYPPG